MFLNLAQSEKLPLEKIYEAVYLFVTLRKKTCKNDTDNPANHRNTTETPKYPYFLAI